MRDVALLVHCLLCDAYFPLVVDTVDNQKLNGAAWKRAEAWPRVEERRCRWRAAGTRAFCFTCLAAAGVQLTAFRAGEQEGVLSVVALPPWDDGSAPLTMYVDAGAGHKRKWTRFLGDGGPQTLDVDGKRGDRVHRAQLKPWGVARARYDDERATPAETLQRVETIGAAWEVDSDHVCAMLTSACPALDPDAFAEIGYELEDMVLQDKFGDMDVS